MTVIAVSQTSIAADTLMTFGNERQLGHNKLRKTTSSKGVRAVLAVSGTAGVADALEQWWCAGAVPANAPKLGGDCTWQLLAVTAAGLAFYSDRVPYPLAVSAPFALGSGGDYALGAMKHGASPRRAVEIACAIDVGCGGDIQVFDLGEALGAPIRGTVSTINPETGKRKIRLAEKVE